MEEKAKQVQAMMGMMAALVNREVSKKYTSRLSC